MDDDPQPTDAEQAACGALLHRITDLYGRIVVPGMDQAAAWRAVLYPNVVMQHFTGYLLGHETLESLVAACRKAGQWAQLPAELVAAIVGMTAEAAVDATPRTANRPATPLHVIMSGGSLAHYFITDHAMPLRTAAEVAGRELVALGFVDVAPPASTVEKWARRYARREGEALPSRGRPRKKSPTTPG